MEEQGREKERERVMDNGDSHLAMHIPCIKTTTHTCSHAYKSNRFEWYKFKFILRCSGQCVNLILLNISRGSCLHNPLPYKPGRECLILQV